MSGQILIVDDHKGVREGLRSLLSSRPEWKVCGEAVDGIDAVEKAKALRPDVILMDVTMPRMDGLDASRLIRQELPACKIIIISQNEEPVVRGQAQAIAAGGYVLKSDLNRTLLPMLDRIAGHVRQDGSTDREVPSPPLATPSSSDSEWLVGGGVLGELVRRHDWSATPLGPIASWPESLKTSVNLILNSQHPMWIGWGEEATFLYNDAYIQVLSLAKHPWALGKPASEVWAEIWEICGPLARKVFQKGEASFDDDVRLFMSRGDFLEETYYSFSYSPIRDESGRVAGLFCPSTEVTPKVINARRLRTLSELSSNALMQKTTRDACASAAVAVAKNPDDIPFMLLYLVEDDGKTARLEEASGLTAVSDAISPPSIDLQDGLRDVPMADALGEMQNKAAPAGAPLWPVAPVVKSVQALVVPLNEVPLNKIAGLPLGPAQQIVSQAIALPLTSRGQDRPLGVLIAGINPTRRLDSEYRTFYELVAGQIAASIQSARAAEEEKQRLTALAELDRAKTAFFSNVSHEFRTPLTLMLGPVEELLARSHTDLPPAAKTQLELVNRNGSRLLRLVNTLLDFSRIEAGRMQATYQETDLAAFTTELASVFRSATEKAGLRLELSCTKTTQPVFVDRGMWEKIVLNLISNAFKFTFEGKIAVSLSQPGERVELRVRDTGVGIPAEEIPRLFDRFHRIENTRSRTHEGSGIGLALVQELVKLHGGSVSAESAVGKGSTFIVSLPLGAAHLPADRIGGSRTLPPAASGAAPFVEEALRWIPDSEYRDAGDEPPLVPDVFPLAAATLAPGDPAASDRPRILIADDNADMRQYVSRLLAQRYQVESVADGMAALAAVRERTPALILSDVMMPNLDGFGLLRELRSDPRTSTIPIILLSARAGEESRVEGMEQGADDYLIKPFSARELLARVQTHLDLARARHDSETALRRRTQQFETLLNEAPLGIYLVDADFRLRQVNPTALAVFGEIPNLIGRDFDEVIHILWPEQYADHIVRCFRHTLETGEPYIGPEQIQERRDRGVMEYYQGQIHRIPLPEGRYGVVCYFWDVSRQVQAREAIAESEKWLRLATEAAELGIWHWYPEGDRSTWDNDRMFEIFGRTREEGPFTENEFTTRVVHPEDREPLHKALLATLQTGARLSVQGRIHRKDGACRWVEITGQLERRADGSPLCILGTVLDITAQKVAQARERQMTAEALAATAKFRAVFEQTPVFAGIMALDGTIIDANQLFLSACGYRDQDVLGRPFWETGWWRHSSEVQAKIQAATAQARQGTPYRETLPYHRADDAARLVDFSLHPIRDEQGEILFLHPTGVDITDLKQAEENYRKLAETLDAEVRIRTSQLEQRNAEVLQQSEQLRDLSSRLLRIQDEERRRIARELHDSAGQILTALGMTLARVSQSALPSVPQLARDADDSQRLVQQLTQEIRTMSYLLHPPLLDEAGLSEALRWYTSGLAERSGLEIKLILSEDFGRLPREMELAMFRLVQECLTNIHRHSGSKSARIKITRQPESVTLDVQDDGEGIPAEKLLQIQSRSSGVGIRGMRERVRQFRGQMNIVSNGKGTTFSFQFPLQEPPNHQTVNHEIENPRPPITVAG